MQAAARPDYSREPALSTTLPAISSFRFHVNCFDYKAGGLPNSGKLASPSCPDGICADPSNIKKFSPSLPSSLLHLSNHSLEPHSFIPKRQRLLANIRLL